MAKFALTLLFVSLITGQLVRLPLLGQGGGLLTSDMAVLVVELIAVIWLLRGRKLAISNFQFPISKFFTPFILWSLFTLVIHLPALGLSNGLIAIAYWVRLATHLLLLPALLILFTDGRVRKYVRRGLIVTVVILVGLGFLQLLVAPNLNLPGWDPHQGRLVSTWLDPNLFGAFLAMGLVVLLPPLTKGRVVERSETEGSKDAGAIYDPLPAKRRDSPFVRGSKLLFFLLTVIALLLTRSRTTFLALGSAVLVFSPFFITRYIRWAGFGLAALILAGLLLGERAGGIVTFDPTVQLRLRSLQQAWQLVQEHPWLGVGYNAYQFAADNSATVHSRAGADNSWLTIWATTGLIGVMLFALPWLVVAHKLVWRPAVLVLLTLFIHSQFVNSFLYGHLLITLAIICALDLSTPGR